MFLKETTRNITSQGRGFLSFRKPLMSVGLPLMKNVFTPLAKSILVPFELTAPASTTDAAIQKIENSNTSIFKWRREWYHENENS